jgi:hypothetical protein
MGVVKGLVGAMAEGYMNPGGTEAHKAPPAYAEAVAVLLGFLLSLAIISLVGLWLWNYSVVPLFEFARPAKSVFQILGLMVFLSIIMP